MNIRCLLCLFVVVLLFGSCSKDNSSVTGLDIRVYSAVGTRVSGSSFDEGDDIGLDIILSSGSSHVVNEKFTYTAGSFEAEGVKWFSPDHTATFEAYYPYGSGNSFPTTYNIPSDQTTIEGYAKADLLLGKAENVAPNPNGVSMNFFHVLSQVIVSIDNQSESPVKSVTIGGTQLKLTVEMDDLSVGLFLAGNPLTDITAYRVDESTFMAIIAPFQYTIDITIETEAGDIVTKSAGTKDFTAGKTYRANVILEEKSITELDIVSDGDIRDWVSGGFLTVSN